MMRRGLWQVLVLGFGLTAAVAGAAEHKVWVLGMPQTAFHRPPLKKVDDFRAMIAKDKADIAAVLAKVGWQGNVDDLVLAAKDQPVQETTIEAGAHIPYMAMRRRGKPDFIDGVIWAGQKPIPAFMMEFQSGGYVCRIYAPKPCGNFWVEQIRKAEAEKVPVIPPTLNIQGSEVCVTQPGTVTVTVTNAVPGTSIALTVDGQAAGTMPATDGNTEKKFDSYATPGSHTVTATMEGVAPASATITVKPCPPTCAVTVAPTPIQSGKPFSIDASGSQVASGVTVGMKSVTVDIVRQGEVVETFELAPPTLKRDGIVLRRSGDYTIRAVATDAAGQKSSNGCEAALKVTAPPLGFFVAGFVGKERMIRDDFLGGRCASLVGIEGGLKPRLGDKAEAELAFGGKINARDSGNSSVFIDAAIHALFNRGFVGGGVSFWDLTKSDTRAAALLLQGGIDLDRDGRYQFVLETRAPFNKFDDLSNNYMFWGGFAFNLNGR